MAEQYVHTLIPVIKDVVPTAAQVQTFLRTVVDLDVVPAPRQVRLRTPTGEFRSVINPFTLEPILLDILRHEELDCVDNVTAAVASLADYDVELAGQGLPTRPPLQIACDEPYWVAVTIRVSAVLRSTSESDEPGHGYGHPCSTPLDRGYFTNPHTGERIEVPGAGCARFWIEIELGKFLFPAIENNNIEILNPSVVDAATKTFGMSFVQGLGPNG